MKRLATTALVLFFVLASGASASTAMQSYQRIWKQDRQFYAPRMPAPLAEFNQPMPGRLAQTRFLAGQPRRVELGRATTLELAHPGPARLRKAQSVLEWEWARVFGPPGQAVTWPRPIVAAVEHHAALRIIRAHLPHWGENPRAVFDPLPPTPAAACPDGYDYELTNGQCYPSDNPIRPH